MKAPITLFTYARPEHTKRTVEALLNNHGVAEHDLIIYSDGPKTLEKRPAVDAVRNYLKSLKGFRSITIHTRPYNYGLARSIIEGVSEVLIQYDRIIVLEDDLITSPYFLKYMNEALEKYANDDRVISIHGYVYPVKETLPEVFFLRGADCWGWATWRRGWALFNPNGQELLDKLRREHLVKLFDFNGAYEYSKMLEAQVKGLNDSWAIRWYASAFLANRLTLYPGRSLAKNIGVDGSGTHCRQSAGFDSPLSDAPVELRDIDVVECAQARQAFETYFSTSKGMSFKKLLTQLQDMFFDKFL